MSEPFIGEIVMFGGNFAPRGWALCDGQLLAIAQNQALFSILGTTYGGDGRTTFGLPDLRGRVPVHAGNGPGLSGKVLGQKSGQETVTLTTAQMPAHNHTGTVQLNCSSGAGSNNRPTDNFPAGDGTGYTADYAPTADAQMNTNGGTANLNNTGGNQPHDNMPPYQVVNYIIALQGIFPSRN